MLESQANTEYQYIHMKEYLIYYTSPDTKKIANIEV